jgi:hypothetical protein
MRSCPGILITCALACGGHGATTTTRDATANAVPTTLATVASNTFAIELDDADTNAYVLSETPLGSGILTAVALSSGEATVLASGFAVTRGPGHALAVDDSNVYFMSGNDVQQLPIDGGSAVTLASGQNGVTGIAVGATTVYWALSTTGTTGEIRAAPIGVAESDAMLIASGASPDDVAVDATTVYWIGVNGTVNEAPIIGGSANQLATVDDLPLQLAVDTTQVYVMGSMGNVYATPLSGGSATILDDYGGGQPNGMDGFAVDASGVYWSQADGDIDHVQLTGETPTDASPQLVRGMGSGVASLGLALDADHVFWVLRDGSVIVLAK